MVGLAFADAAEAASSRRRMIMVPHGRIEQLDCVEAGVANAR
jgi:hypothetical protein